MSAKLSETCHGRDSIRQTLGELRACHDEFDRFFGQVGTELGRMSEDLAQRQRRWQAEHTQVHRGASRQTSADAATQPEIAEYLKAAEQKRAELQDTQDSLRQQLEHLRAVATELTEAHHSLQQQPAADSGGTEERLQELLDAFRLQQTSWIQERDHTQARIEQLEAVTSELTATGRGLAEAHQDVMQHREKLEAAAKKARASRTDTDRDRQKLEEHIRELEQQQMLLQQERAELEADLESVRNRAAEMTDSLAEQKQAATEQQARWADELKRMRRLLEGMSTLLVQGKAAGSGASAEMAVPPTVIESVGTGNEDRALDSVLAQFEMLQKDLTRRRAAAS